MDTVEKVAAWLKDKVIAATMGGETVSPFPKIRVLKQTRKGMFIAVYQMDGDPITYRIDIKKVEDDD